MNIFIASDHAGFELKRFLIKSLSAIGHTMVDCGAYSPDPTDDYPPYIAKTALAVSEAEELRIVEDESGELYSEQYSSNSLNSANSANPSNSEGRSNVSTTRGIVIGGSGQGEAIVANKFPHVRAALCYGGEHAEEIITLSREHNNANVLSLGARFLDDDQALELTLQWLNTPFSGDGRHVRRLHEVESIERKTDELLYE